MDLLSDLRAPRPTLSFEFFPPKTQAAADTLFHVIEELRTHQPSFVSVTYGAGGSTRELTRSLVARILQETDLPAVPHLTCISHQPHDITEILDAYQHLGVQTVLALRGDPPRNDPHHDWSQEAFPHATDLVRTVRQHPGKFTIGVAGFPEGHPLTPNRLEEMDHFKAKVDAGADYICTQLFFDNVEFFDYRERCQLAGIDLPIVAGIMPLTSLTGMKRMAELAAGTRFPARLLRQLQNAGDDPESVRQAGLDYARQQCQELLDAEVDGLHLYTLNKSQGLTQLIDALDF